MTPNRSEDLKTLINLGIKEKYYQSFLEDNTGFIPREFVQNHGIHLKTVFREISLGNEYSVDLCYLSKSSLDWNCVLIELEKPHSTIFKNNEKPSVDFQEGLEDIRNWTRWIKNNKEYFIREKLNGFLNPLGDNPVKICYLLVIGRRINDDSSLRKKLQTYEKENFKIISFDSLLENPSQERLFTCSIRNEYTIVRNKHLIHPPFFIHGPTHSLKIHSDLKESAFNYFDKDPSEVIGPTVPESSDLPNKISNIDEIPENQWKAIQEFKESWRQKI